MFYHVTVKPLVDKVDPFRILCPRAQYNITDRVFSFDCANVFQRGNYPITTLQIDKITRGNAVKAEHTLNHWSFSLREITLKQSTISVSLMNPPNINAGNWHSLEEYAVVRERVLVEWMEFNQTASPY